MKRKHFFTAVSSLLLALVLCTALLHQADSFQTVLSGGSSAIRTTVLASAGDLTRADIGSLLGESTSAHQEDALLSDYALGSATDTDDATHTSLPRSGAAVKAVGRVVRKDVRLRTEQDPDATILLFLQENAYVSVLEEADGWYLVSYDGSTGYVIPDYIELLARDAEFTTYATVSADKLALCSIASVTGDTLATLAKNTGLTVVGFVNGWLEVTYGGKTGFVPADSVELTTVKPVVRKASASTGKSNSSGKAVEVSGSGSDIVALAMQYEGVPYVYGGASEKGFDCSGFTMFVYDQFGCSLPHGATSQLNYGSYVDKSSLQAGDLVFFQGTSNDNAAASHVGIYIGDGQFIHASSSSGRTVKVNSLSESYYAGHYLTARRLCS